MSLPGSQRGVQPETVAQNPQGSVPLQRLTPKDLSLITLVPKWGGTEHAIPLAEFFESIEGTANIGNWTEADQIQICVLRLTDNARDFYRATPELKDPAITWAAFKEHFLKRFRDVRTDQYHFTQLQQARQRKNESPSEFLDRCKILARRTVPCVTDAAMRRAYSQQADRMLLAAYTAGLTGQAGREVRLRAPATADEAVRIAITVEQAELQERRNGSFYTDAEADISPSGRVQNRTARHGKEENSIGQSNPTRHVRTRNANSQRPTQKAQSDAPVKCYECSGYGHFARDCANRKQRAGISKAEAKGGAKLNAQSIWAGRRADQPAEN